MRSLLYIPASNAGSSRSERRQRCVVLKHSENRAENDWDARTRPYRTRIHVIELLVVMIIIAILMARCAYFSTLRQLQPASYARRLQVWTSIKGGDKNIGFAEIHRKDGSLPLWCGEGIGLTARSYGA